MLGQGTRRKYLELVSFIFEINDNYERRRGTKGIRRCFAAAVEPARALRVTFQSSTLMIINVTVPTNSTKTNVRESRVNDEF